MPAGQLAPSRALATRAARSSAGRAVRQHAACRRTAAAAAAGAAPQTLFDKIWASHLVDESADGSTLLYIDRHLVHEVTSPQAFEGLRVAGRSVRRPGCTLATADHNVPTSDRSAFKDVASFIKEFESRNQVLALEENVREFGVAYFGLDDRRQGIVHIVGPEQGFTLPGCTTVCGDSHTATHGAFGALAFGIGTSEVEHVLATQTLVQQRAANMLVRVDGALPAGVTSKDLVLHVIGIIGTAGGTGHVVEFGGEAVRGLSMEARMSMCNMAIEAGARAGMVAPDDVTFEYLRGRPLAPTGAAWDAAVSHWRTLASDPGAAYAKTVVVAASDVAPTVTWGTSPQDVAPISGRVPDPSCAATPQRAAAISRSLQYMGLTPGTPLAGLPVDKVFIGSCTNARIEDLRAAAAVALGRAVAPGVYAMVVPGSGVVKEQAEAEARAGLDAVFTSAGFDWREPGCSMCLAMNPDRLEPGERCASTSNRNFEGRQGAGGRTHLVSPAMAAAAAVTGVLTDARALAPLGPLPRPPTDSKAFIGVSPVSRAAAAPLVAPPPLQPGAAAHGGKAGGIPPFVNLRGVAAPLDVQNVDTDMIIPKQFLKTTKRTGLGVSAFFDMRYTPDGSERPEFVLNRDPFRNAVILIAGENFGCGSSREHAPWALSDFGITCVIAPSFADIFFNNCFKNGMLPIKLQAEQVAQLMEDASAGLPLEVDLPSQRVVRATGAAFSFDVDDFRKHCLLNGLDDIGLTLAKADAITAFEARQAATEPWLASAIPLREPAMA